MEDRAAERLYSRVNEELDRLAPKTIIAAFDSGRPATVSVTATIRPKPQKDGGGYELVVSGNSAVPGHRTRDDVHLNDDLQLDLYDEQATDDPVSAPVEDPATEPAQV